MSPKTLRIIVLCVVPLCAGCGERTAAIKTKTGMAARPAAAAQVRIERCSLEVTLDPESHRLEATATLTLASRVGAGALQLKLHPDLWVDSIVHAGKAIEFSRAAEPGEQAENRADTGHSDAVRDAFRPAVYELTLKRPIEVGQDLVLKYGGRLFQDVAAGEKPGEIHNFAMRAHVGPNGVFLSESGCWYPSAVDQDRDVESPLTHYEVSVADVDGMTWVASGNRVEAPTVGHSTWRTPFAIEGLALVGGRHVVQTRQVDGVTVRVHLREDHAAFASGLLDAVDSYLRLYQPLLGEYPYSEFTVVENFFSSGFAYPGFTVLSEAVIGMGAQGLRPGYLDHEMLHNWWGNGVFVSKLDGNWCECLTSYCANYMRLILEGDIGRGRDQRRDICYGLSRLEPDDDKPLDRFGRENVSNRFIGYQKGSMVFAMLSDRVGTDVLWAALRRLYRARLGRHAGWGDIQKAVEAESGQALKGFFDAWVRGSGVPDVEIDEVRFEPAASRLMVAIAQRGGPFDMRIPIRMVYDNNTIERLVTVDRPYQAVAVPLLEAPTAIELDPDFRVMRRIAIKDIMPTISGLRPPASLSIVRSAGDADAYDTVAEQFRKQYKKKEPAAVHEFDVSGLTPEYLAHGHALILGRACEHAVATEPLSGSPLSIGREFFEVDGKRYDGPTDAVLCSVRNRQDPGRIICFYYGNSEAALKKAGWVTFYGGDSLIVFADGRPVLRKDFENTSRIVVQHDGMPEYAPREGVASDSTGQGDRLE